MTDLTNIGNSVLVQGATLADIERMIDRAIKARMEDFVRSVQPKPDPLVKRVDAAKQLGVSVVTLDAYSKHGILHPRHVGGRIYYAQSELDTYKFNKKK